MTDPGHASDHGDRRAPGNARLSLFGDHQGQRDRTGGGYQEYNYKMSKLRVLPIFWIRYQEPISGKLMEENRFRFRHLFGASAGLLLTACEGTIFSPRWGPDRELCGSVKRYPTA
jgi:hypothetical protein